MLLVGCKKKLMCKIYWFNGFKLFDLNSDFFMHATSEACTYDFKCMSRSRSAVHILSSLSCRRLIC